jgi:hypothetical protein
MAEFMTGILKVLHLARSPPSPYSDATQTMECVCTSIEGFRANAREGYGRDALQRDDAHMDMLLP